MDQRATTAQDESRAKVEKLPPARQRPLRVALVTETFPPEINGVAHTLGHFVTGLIDKGHSLQVIRPRQGREDLPKRHERLEEILHTSAPIPGYRQLRFGLPARGLLLRRWRQFQPEVIYIATEGPLGGSALKAALQLGVPAVTGFHTNFDYYSRYYGIGFLERAINGFLRRFHNRSQCTLVPTKALQEQLRSKGFDNTRVLSRGVDIRLFKPARRSAALRDQWGIGEDALAVLYVGRLAPEKNLALAVEAFRALQTRRPDAKFVLVGDGPEARELRRLHPDFVFCGMRTGEDLAAHYASGDVFLFPSTSETYGNVILEAMASGLAVLAFDYAAGREHVVPGKNGQLARFKDRDEFIRLATSLVESSKALQAMGMQARLSAEDLDWRRIYDRFEEILFQHVNGDGSHETTASHE